MGNSERGRERKARRKGWNWTDEWRAQEKDRRRVCKRKKRRGQEIIES